MDALSQAPLPRSGSSLEPYLVEQQRMEHKWEAKEELKSSGMSVS